MTYGINLRVIGKAQADAALNAVKTGTQQVAAAQERVAIAAAKAAAAEKQRRMEAQKARAAERLAMQPARDRAQVVGRFGGVIGGAVAAFAAPTKGMVAAGLAAFAFAKIMQSVTAGIQRAEERTRRVAEGQLNLLRATQAATRAADLAARGAGMDAREAIGQLATGGVGAVAAGQRFGRMFGAGGIKAAGTLQKAGLLTPEIEKAMQMAVQSGLITPEQFAEILSGNKGLMQGRSGIGLAEAVLSKAGAGRIDLASQLATLDASGFGARFRDVDAAQGLVFGTSLDRFGRVATTGDLREQAGRIASPETAAQLDQWRTEQEQLQVLQKIADQQGLLARIWLDFTSTEGSAATRLTRGMQDSANIFDPAAP